MLEFTFNDLHVDPPMVGRGELASLLGQVGCLFSGFRIIANAEVFYADDEFPVAEFSHLLRKWLGEEAREGQDFTFDSIFFEDSREIVIALNGGKWMLSSVELPESLGGYSLEEVESASGLFYEKLKSECAVRYNVELL